MISVYDIGNTNYERNGDAVLHPISCEATEDAGGSYEIALVHPIEEINGAWSHLLPGALVKVPVPVAYIESSFVGEDVDVYKTNVEANLRDGPSEPQRITYQSWSAGATYSVGSRVTYNSQNYQCTEFDQGSGWINVPPPNNASWWKKIANYSGGATIIATLPPNTEVYYVANAENDFYNVITKDNIEGYMRTINLTFVRHETVEPVPAREVEDQLFRIYKVTVNTDGKTCSVNAIHVSYDLTGILIQECDLALLAPAAASARIKDAFMIPYAGSISTNLTSEANGTYTGNLNGKNGTYAFLDPDKGMVPYFRAKLIRDNWDIFLMANTLTDRGLRLIYGHNLRGVTWTRDSSNIITRVVPVAKNTEGGDLLLPEKWVDSSIAWPVVRMERLTVQGQIGKDDGTGTGTTWTETTLLNQMRTKAQERFTVDHADAVNVELLVNFTMMGDTEEYRQYKKLENVYLYDAISVKDPNVGLNVQLQVSRIVWDCINNRCVSIRVGNVFDYGGRTVFGYNIGDGAIDFEKLSTETVRRIESSMN